MADKKQCLKCSLETAHTNFYKSYSDWHGDGLLPYCKTCLKSYVHGNEENIGIVREVMRVLDKPLKSDIWQQAKESRKDTLGEYLRMINLNSKEENHENSIFEKKSGHSFQASSDSTEEIVTISEETTKYWSKGYDNWEYLYLEDQRFSLMSSFECPDYGMEMIMKDICFINLDIEKMRIEKKVNGHIEITKLIKSRSELMNSANMNPIQSTGADGNDQITFGTLIKKWENERPVPVQLEDEMKEYIDTHMAGHLAKMEGLSNELTDKYDKAMNKYTIDFKDIHKNDEDDEE